MLKLVVTSFLCLVATLAQAGPVKFVGGDNSQWTAVCLAALDSDQAMQSEASAEGLTQNDVNALYCNGVSVKRFVSQYSKAGEGSQHEPMHVTGFLFSKGDGSPETALCLAAVSSSEQFSKIVKEHFATVQNLESSVFCNDMPLKVFVRMYRSPTYTAFL